MMKTGHDGGTGIATPVATRMRQSRDGCKTDAEQTWRCGCDCSGADALPSRPPPPRYRSQVFHAGTALNAAGEVVANGGRVLNVTALGDDVAEAQQRAYQVRHGRGAVLRRNGNL